MGYREVKNALIQKREMQSCGSKSEKCICKYQKDLLVEVEHVKAHGTEKDKQEMSHFEKFVADGNEKADELVKAGAMLDEGFMAEVRAKTVQQRER